MDGRCAPRVGYEINPPRPSGKLGRRLRGARRPTFRVYYRVVATCEYLPRCPVFARFKNSVWVELYCRSDFEKCERFKLVRKGQRPPDAMLPNGALPRGVMQK